MPLVSFVQGTDFVWEKSEKQALASILSHHDFSGISAAVYLVQFQKREYVKVKEAVV